MVARGYVQEERSSKGVAPKFFGRRYPWKRWFSMPQFTLIKGRDYNGRTDTMAQQVRNAASRGRHNVKVSIQVPWDGESLTVYVLNRPGVPVVSIG